MRRNHLNALSTWRLIKREKRTVVFLALFLLTVPGQAMSQETPFRPNLAPAQDEVVLPDDPSFTEACMSQIADSAKKFDWRFGKSILTRSSEWGLVWRMDFELPTLPPGGDLGLVNRVTCWRKSELDGFGVVYSFGQRVDRLR
jgi:hypothetical protein